MIDGRYTEKELFKLFSDNGWTRLQFKLVDQGHDTLPEGGTIAHWLYRAMQPPTDGCLTTKNFIVLKWPDGTYVFDGKNPFAAKPEPDAFAAEVSDYIKSSDLAMTESVKVDSENEVAKVVAVEGTEEKRVIIRRNKDGNLEHVSLTTEIATSQTVDLIG